MGNFDQKVNKFIEIFWEQNGYNKVLQGLQNTLMIAIAGLIIGIIIGTIIATVRVLPKYKTLPKVLNAICKVYLSVIRGTPTMVQVLIFNFVIFASIAVNEVIVGGVAFGINSGAYVAEIVRSGIMSIDKGQMEAGRSLGLSSGQTMKLIIMPQAFKNVLPALINEMIVLLKETSIIGYIGMTDITKAATLVQSRTYEAFVPLIAAAVFYWVLVTILTYFMGKLERRLRKSDRK
mgnify:CR=1 FL=1